MADNANLHLKNYIPDKNINEKLLTENLIPSNLQEVHVLASQTVITNDYQMGNF